MYTIQRGAGRIQIMNGACIDIRKHYTQWYTPAASVISKWRLYIKVCMYILYIYISAVVIKK